LTCIKLLIIAARTVAAAFKKRHPMFDLIVVALGLGFFALSVAYAFACDWL
jgi:hypothetical protein